MSRKTIYLTMARVAGFFILCLAVQASHAEYFEFNWPAPNKVSITEKTSLNGISSEIHMRAEFAKRPQAEGFAFAVRDMEIVEVKGVPEKHKLDFILANTFWPTYLVGDSGKLLGIAGMETLTENLLVFSEQLNSTAQAKDTLQSEEFQTMLRDRVALVWEGLVGAVANRRLESGESTTRSDEFSAYGMSFPVRITTTHLGSSEEVAGAVRLQTVITFDEDTLEWFTKKIVAQLVGNEAAKSLTIKTLQRKVSFDAVVSPATLLPHSVNIMEHLSLKTDKNEELGISQRQSLTFDWTN